MALAFALGTVGGDAHAANRLVTNCTDHDPGSLRAAMTVAMSNDLVDASGLTCSTISLSTGALASSVKNLTVRGAGTGRLTVTNAAMYGRVFSHEGTGTLNLQGMTVTSGMVSPTAGEAGTQGGCIYSKGTVSLGNYFDPTDAASGVVVSDCTAVSTQAEVPAEGGAIFAMNGVALAHNIVSHAHAIARDQAMQSYGGGIRQGSGFFTMKYSEVRDCSAEGLDGVAGGISAPSATGVEISHSTIAGNTASFAAGGASLRIVNGALIKMENTTVSGNVASILGGIGLTVDYGIQHGVIRIYSSTITDNRDTTTNPQSAAGIDLTGTAQLESTIAARNFNNANPSDLGFTNSASSTGANNLFGVALGNVFPPGIGHIVSADPRLALLANRGGFSRTHVPLANSPAINAGNNVFASTTDQRGPGFPRVIGGTSDIGAAEFDSDRIFTNGFD